MAYGEPITLTIAIIAATSALIAGGGAAARGAMEKSAARQRLEALEQSEVYDYITGRRLEQAATLQATSAQIVTEQQLAYERERLLLLGAGVAGILLFALAARKTR